MNEIELGFIIFPVWTLCVQEETLLTFSTPFKETPVQYSNVQGKWKLIITETSELPCKQDIEQKWIVGIQRGLEAHVIPEINVAVKVRILISENYCLLLETSTEV